jgi:hypothetical protein
MAGTGIQSFVAFRAQISAECHKPRDRLKPLAFRAQNTAECRPPLANILRNANSLVKFDRGMP